MNNQDIKAFIGNDSFSLVDAMQAIDQNTYGILFLVNTENQLTGCITDGDIRRYLLSGGKLDDIVKKAANLHPRAATSLKDAKTLYHKKNYVMIPIIDENGRVVDLFNGDRKITQIRKKLQIPVVINAGGKGTRLDPFTRVLPKPLIPVGELPIIEHIMREYQTYSCNDFHIIVNYKRELMKAYFSENEKKYSISWYNEEKPLGTGGGLRLLRGKFDSTFFFTNCDTLLTADYEKMLQFHKENQNIVTMICAYKNLTIPYGIVETGVNGIIEGIKEKPLMSFFTNTGVYIVEPEVIEEIEDNEFIGFPDIVERLRKKGKKVAAYPVSENDWMDMGQLSELEKMREKLYEE